jgi:hypothetical protein
LVSDWAGRPRDGQTHWQAQAPADCVTGSSSTTDSDTQAVKLGVSSVAVTLPSTVTQL